MTGAPLRHCRGYRSATYDQGPHDEPDDDAHFYTHKTQCKRCYLAYAADWRARRETQPRGIEHARSAAPRRGSVLDGAEALRAVLLRAGYLSVAAAVADHAVFLPPSTVEQTGGSALFPTIRDMARRGTYDVLPDGRHVLLDDNGSPTDAFLWSAGLASGPDVQYNHVWAASKDPDAYTALWNLVVTPAFLAKATDGAANREVQDALRWRAFALYGRVPTGQPVPVEPEGFSRFRWAPFAPAVEHLERELRARLAANAKSRTAAACREVGWLFSGWQPDASILGQR